MKINEIEKKLDEADSEEQFQATSAELQEKKMELEDLIAYQAHGAWIRARAKYYIDGEKPSKLFCSLEKYNGVQKHIPKLQVVRNGAQQDLLDQTSIEDEILDL